MNATAIAIASGLLLASAPVRAESPTAVHATESTSSLVHSIGARVGGYGFHRDDADARAAWDECRMNGIGIFAERRLGHRVFLEAGLDAYFSESFPMQDNPDDLPINRLSGLASIAAGVRTDLVWRLAGYVQVGTGLEFTRVSVPYADGEIRDQLVMPFAFIGVGGDIRIGDRTYLGMHLRTHAMGNFEYDPAMLDAQPGWTTPPAAADVFDPSVDVAAQGQFYLRRSL